MLIYAPAMGFHQFLKFHQLSYTARSRSHGQTEIVLFYYENDGKCKVKVQRNNKTFKIDHITVQNVALPGWEGINKSVYGYHCHNLPTLLLETNLMQRFLKSHRAWDLKEEFGIEDILPSRGGIAFMLFMSVLIAMFESSTEHKTIEDDVKKMNSWSSDMIRTLEDNPFILHPTHPANLVSEVFFHS